MSKFEGHTLGFWKAEGLYRDGLVHITAKEYTGDLLNDRHNVATCNGPDKNANAALIAAAPDLLRQRDELAEILRLFIDVHNNLGKQYQVMSGIVWKAEQALAALDQEA